MSLFKGSLRPPAILSDEAIEAYVAAIRAEVEIDPLFRRRLRGQVVNRYVATREGSGAHERKRHMGTLGRAVLYASFSLAVSVTGVLAASQEAMPGDVLYPLKRQVEELRVEILPDRFHAELASYALSERIGEMDRLADAGDWNGVARLATVVEAGYVELLAMDSDGADVALHQHFVVLNGLFDRLPDGARSALQSTIERAADTRGGNPQNGLPAGDRALADPFNGNAQSGGSSASSASPQPTRSRNPTRSATPEATPMPEATLPPEAAPRGERPAKPDPMPKASRPAKPDDQ